MNPLTREWVDKAEGDYVVARRELRARRSPNFDAACFHAQQAAEKYMKACLHAAGVRFGKTHDLVALLKPLLPIQPEWELLREAARTLTDCAVRFRYPGASADKAKARQAVRDCELIRARARARLGLAPLKPRTTPNAARRKRR